MHIRAIVSIPTLALQPILAGSVGSLARTLVLLLFVTKRILAMILRFSAPVGAR